VSHNDVQRENARLRRDLAATREALVNEQARTRRMEPMWEAGHALAAHVYSNKIDPVEQARLYQALLLVHLAMTPSPDRGAS
jgi:hypothetical protein